MRRLGRALLAVALLLFIAWGALALHFAGPRPATLADALAAGWAVAGVVLLWVVGGRARLGFAVLALALLGWWSSLAPRNDRAWQPDVARPPYGTVEGDRLVLHDVRNFVYRSETDWDARWETRTYDLAQLDGLDLFLSYWGSPAIAHTILSWSFRDGQHLAVSIETRKEVGESYSAVAGFFKQYELYYVAADERDVVRLRTDFRGEQVYLYPLRVSPAVQRDMLLDYVAAMNRLAGQPAWYDAATQNCTTTIRTHVQHIGAAQPWDWRLLVNGYIDQLLYERGTIDTSRPFDAVRAAAFVNPRAQAADGAPDFPARIRDGLVRPPA